MSLTERINAFNALGQSLQSLHEEDFQSLADRCARENPWFTKENVRMALDGVVKFLQYDKLTSWTAPYSFPEKSHTIAIVAAGNIPLVGFHDLLSVLISGHSIQLKVSSKDTVSMKFVIDKLIDIEPRFQQRITLVERLKDFDAVIATGSDNTARYFDYYFGKYPNIIRKNRTSVGILQGTESSEELLSLGHDVFSYFGLGCRNISKLFVPTGYDLGTFFRAIQPFENIIHHHKYCNNYDYQKSIMLVNRIPFLDNGFVMVHENERMVSPISVLYYEFYSNADELHAKLQGVKDKIQCIVGNVPPATTLPGHAQYPELWDYADQVDTLSFLSKLS